MGYIMPLAANLGASNSYPRMPHSKSRSSRPSWPFSVICFIGKCHYDIGNIIDHTIKALVAPKHQMQEVPSMSD